MTLQHECSMDFVSICQQSQYMYGQYVCVNDNCPYPCNVKIRVTQSTDYKQLYSLVRPQVETVDSTPSSWFSILLEWFQTPTMCVAPRQSFKDLTRLHLDIGYVRDPVAYDEMVMALMNCTQLISLAHVRVTGETVKALYGLENLECLAIGIRDTQCVHLNLFEALKYFQTSRLIDLEVQQHLTIPPMMQFLNTTRWKLRRFSLNSIEIFSSTAADWKMWDISTNLDLMDLWPYKNEHAPYLNNNVKRNATLLDYCENRVVCKATTRLYDYGTF